MNIEQAGGIAMSDRIQEAIEYQKKQAKRFQTEIEIYDAVNYPGEHEFLAQRLRIVETCLKSLNYDLSNRENPRTCKGTIFIGYQGVGKSTIAQRRTDYIDLESGSFWIHGKRDDSWHEIYCNIAEHLCRQGKNVFVSSHAVVRERLRMSDCAVVAIYPAPSMRDSWVQRLHNRYIQSRKEKDFKAWKNAEELFEENIHDLESEKTFGHVVINRIPYDLSKMIADYNKKLKGAATP